MRDDRLPLWDTRKNGDPFHDNPFFNPWQRGGSFNNPEQQRPRMNPDVEAYAEKMVRDEWQKKLQDHGNSKCSECGHTGWTHSPRGCCAYINPPTVASGNGTVIDPSLSWDELQTYKCKCSAHELGKSNHEIIWGEKDREEL